MFFEYTHTHVHSCTQRHKFYTSMFYGLRWDKFFPTDLPRGKARTSEWGYCRAAMLCIGPIQPTRTRSLSRQLTKHRPTPPTAPGLEAPSHDLQSGRKALPLLQLWGSGAACTKPRAPQFVRIPMAEKLTTRVKNDQRIPYSQFHIVDVGFHLHLPRNNGNGTEAGRGRCRKSNVA